MPRLKLDNYTRFEHRLAEKLIRSDLSGREFRVFLLVLRLTVGWDRKKAQISSYELAAATGLDRRNALRVLGGLIQKGMIIKHPGESATATSSFEIVGAVEKWGQSVTRVGDDTRGEDTSSRVIADAGNSVADDTGGSSARPVGSGLSQGSKKRNNKKEKKAKSLRKYDSAKKPLQRLEDQTEGPDAVYSMPTQMPKMLKDWLRKNKP